MGERAADINECDVHLAGNTVRVPCASVNGKIVVVTGRWVKVAAIKGEEWQDEEMSLAEVERLIANLKNRKQLEADLFTFTQKPTEPEPRFSFFYERDSVAAVRISSFEDWWTNRVSTDLRRDVRLAAKRGVVVRQVAFDDEFIRGIVQIYNETPFRQGRRFWHYGKGFDSVKRENSSYLSDSEFIGAFWGDELIGFLKIVYVGQFARLMQIIAKEAHRGKRPMNALIAKAVEVCAAKRCVLLTYGKYYYRQGADSVTAFKHRNGFEEIVVPRYYVPLTAIGKIALQLRIHRGLKAVIPAPVIRGLKTSRAAIYRRLRFSGT